MIIGEARFQKRVQMPDLPCLLFRCFVPSSFCLNLVAAKSISSKSCYYEKAATFGAGYFIRPI